jgi:hypothetical protein
MKEEYRRYLLVKAEMAKIRLGMNVGMSMSINRNPLSGSSLLVPLIILSLESIDGQDNMSVLNDAHRDLNLVISEDSYMTPALSYDEFLANQRDKNLTKLGINE